MGIISLLYDRTRRNLTNSHNKKHAGLLHPIALTKWDCLTGLGWPVCVRACACVSVQDHVTIAGGKGGRVDLSSGLG